MFAGVKKLIQEIFLPHHFFGKYKSLPSIVRNFCTLPINKFGLVLQNLVISAKNKFLSLQRAIMELIRVLRGEKSFQPLINFRQLNRKIVMEEKTGMMSTRPNYMELLISLKELIINYY